MARIIISENVSLDGVVQDPTGEEGFAGGGWFNRLTDDDFAAWAEVELDEARGAVALLLGRRSDEWFGARWTSRTGEWADVLNQLPKYVVSSTAGAAAWTNGRVLPDVDAVMALKGELDGDIVVYASRRLVRSLFEHGLVEEVRLTVHPIVVGDGERLFDTARTPVRLVEARTVGTGLVHLTYAVVPEREPQAAVAGSVPAQNHNGSGTP
jgi:dihydrofolate reductase